MKIQTATLALSLLLASCSPAPDHLQVVSEYQHIKNSRNIESALNMFSTDASLHFGSLGSLSGLEQIRDIHEYDLALDTRLQFDHCRMIDHQVSCRCTETNEWLNLAQIGPITYQESLFTFTTDGRISSIVTTLSPASSEDLETAIVQFDAWARKNHADEYAELFSLEGEFSYSYENGKKVLALLRKWKSD